MISVVVATYNRKHSLSGCIASILAQTHGEFEIVIVDDGSTDGTEEMMQEIFSDPRIRYVRLSENQGASAARNRGIAEARGEFIMVWDSDDELHPNALETLIAAFQKHPDAVVVSAPARVLRGETEVAYPKRDEGYVTLNQILCKYLPDNEKVRMARADTFKKVRYVSRNIDFLVNIRLAERGPWYRLAEPLGLVHAAGADSLTQRRKKFNARSSVERAPHLAEFLNEFGDRLLKNCPKRYAALSYGAAFGLFLAGDTAAARGLASEAARYDASNPRHRLLSFIIRIPLARLARRILFSEI